MFNASAFAWVDGDDDVNEIYLLFMETNCKYANV